MRLWPSFSRKERNSSRISETVRDLFIGDLPMKEYSVQGASPQTSASPAVQKNLPHDGHSLRAKPFS